MGKGNDWGLGVKGIKLIFYVNGKFGIGSIWSILVGFLFNILIG